MAKKTTFELEGKDRGVVALLTKVTEKERALERAAKRTGQASRRATDSAKSGWSSVRTQIVGTVAGLVGVQQGVAGVIRGYANWLRSAREITNEARKAANEIIALAALQEGGTKAKRVQAAAALATRYGITDRGEAFNTVQALQSARGGDFKEGMAAAGVVFAATQVGIPLEKAREAEVLGASQKREPGEALREFFIAGQASSRDPGVLAGAAPGLAFFENKTYGTAAAGVLAGSVKPDELTTFVKAAGIATSDASSLTAFYESQGLTSESTERERLQVLRREGIDTPAELKAVGLTEMRQQQAVSTLVQNLGDVSRIYGEIEERDKPGLFARERLGVEKELPMAARARRLNVLESMYADELAFGPGAEPATQAIENRKIRGIAMTRLGFKESSLGIVSEKGETGPFGELMFRYKEHLNLGKIADSDIGASGLTSGARDDLHRVMQEVRDELKANTDAMRDQANASRENSEVVGQNTGAQPQYLGSGRVPTMSTIFDRPRAGGLPNHHGEGRP